MRLKLWVLLLIIAVITFNCGEKEVKSIGLEDAIFRAEGYHPSWKLEIDSKNGIHFYSNSKLGKIVTPNSKIYPIMDIAATSYHAKTESAIIKVEIFKKQCLDSKKSSETKYEVRIQAKTSTDSEYQNFQGCGEYVR